jgi:hypothetical protein
VDAAYERRSVAVTSNIKPAGFDTIMPKTLTTTAVDRLLHHATESSRTHDPNAWEFSGRKVPPSPKRFRRPDLSRARWSLTDGEREFTGRRSC